MGTDRERVLGDDVHVGDEVYINGGIVLPHKEIKSSILQPEILWALELQYIHMAYESAFLNYGIFFFTLYFFPGANKLMCPKIFKLLLVCVILACNPVGEWFF